MITIAAPIDADTLRIRSEFLDLPGLQLTIGQAARLLNVSPGHAATLLSTLEDERFLEAILGRDGDLVFRRRGVPPVESDEDERD